MEGFAREVEVRAVLGRVKGLRPLRGACGALDAPCDSARVGSRGAKNFALQQADRSDYGTDVQIEARSGQAMTNARSHVQLKGTTQAANADGSVSVPVARTNLNRLLAQSNSTYVCYHLPSKRLLARRADDVYSEYEHRGADWQRQESITVRFVQLFDTRFQERLHARMIAEGKLSRDRRLAWIQSPCS